MSGQEKPPMLAGKKNIKWTQLKRKKQTYKLCQKEGKSGKDGGSWGNGVPMSKIHYIIILKNENIA